MKEELRHIIESLLFVSETPLSIQKIKSILDLLNSKVVVEALEHLKQEYEERKGGFYLSEVAGGYQLRTRPEHKEWIKKMLQNRPARLSKATMETLAIIAYKQPVIRSDIEYIRGVDCGGILRILLERKIIRVMGRKEIPGRPMIYGTTQTFLEMFELKDLNDLPTPKEIQDFNKTEEDVLSGSLNKDSDSMIDNTFLSGPGSIKTYDIFDEHADYNEDKKPKTRVYLVLSRYSHVCKKSSKYLLKLKKAGIVLGKRQKLKPGRITTRTCRAQRRLTRKKRFKKA